MVSTKHANFIQADPGGSADDVRGLMAIGPTRCGALGVRSAEIRLIGFAKPQGHEVLSAGRRERHHDRPRSGAGPRAAGPNLGERRLCPGPPALRPARWSAPPVRGRSPPGPAPAWPHSLAGAAALRRVRHVGGPPRRGAARHPPPVAPVGRGARAHGRRRCGSCGRPRRGPAQCHHRRRAAHRGLSPSATSGSRHRAVSRSDAHAAGLAMGEPLTTRWLGRRHGWNDWPGGRRPSGSWPAPSASPSATPSSGSDPDGCQPGGPSRRSIRPGGSLARGATARAGLPILLGVGAPGAARWWLAGAAGAGGPSAALPTGPDPSPRPWPAPPGWSGAGLALAAGLDAAGGGPGDRARPRPERGAAPVTAVGRHSPR